MPTLSGIYDSAWIQPVCKIKENISILTSGYWYHYRVHYIEPLPATPASIIDMVAQAGLTALAANATINKQIVPILQLNDTEMLHLRWEPLDLVEGLLWELSGSAKFNTRSMHARVDRDTRRWDPHLVSTTFWVMGMQKDMNLEVRNAMAYATPVARFIFFGYRYVIEELQFPSSTPQEKEDVAKLKQGNLETVRRLVGATTWLPAEARAS